MLFITEKQRKQHGGTCYFEFQKGQENKKYKPVYWQEESLLLHMDIMYEIALHNVIPDFDYYGITIIDKEKWNAIQRNAEKETVTIKEVINELCTWVEENFKKFDYFVICGI